MTPTASTPRMHDINKQQSAGTMIEDEEQPQQEQSLSNMTPN